MFEKIYQENLFIMKLLVTQPEFLEDVQKIREKIKIPKTGFRAGKAQKNGSVKLSKKYQQEKKDYKTRILPFFIQNI